MQTENNKPLVSVIVPVYKVEKYLTKCIQSLVKQTYTNIEIYLVDDGSPDSSGEICEDYARKDSRIKVIHKPNGGLSDARNAALDVCTGEYVTLVDSDDWVSIFYIENLMRAIECTGKKLAISWFQNIQENQAEVAATRVKETEIHPYDTEATLKKMFYQRGVETSAWGKLYAKNLFEGIRYPVGRLYEDVPVTYRLIERAGGAAIIPNVDYYYLQRKESIQYQQFNPRKLDAVKHWEQVMLYVDTELPSLSVAVRSRYFRSICNILFQINTDDAEKYRRELWEKLKKQRKCVLKDKNSKMSSRIAALLSYCGYGLTSKIYHATQMRG